MMPPADVIIHPNLIVAAGYGKTILSQIEAGKPTDALRDMMRDGD